MPVAIEELVGLWAWLFFVGLGFLSGAAIITYAVLVTWLQSLGKRSILARLLSIMSMGILFSVGLLGVFFVPAIIIRLLPNSTNTVNDISFGLVGLFVVLLGAKILMQANIFKQGK